MQFLFLFSTLLPLLVTANPVPGVLFAKDGSIRIVARDAIPNASPEAYAVPSVEELEKRQASSTANDLVNGICRPVTVIFARGTTEAGNIGTIVGPPLRNFLNAALGANNVAFQGVNYPADVAGFLAGGSASGAATMASLANQAASQCPQTQIVLGGYSQGAQVVSKATAQLGSSTISRIKAVVLFGNPNGPNTPVPNISAGETKIYCAPGDDICAGGDLVLPPHLSYGLNTPDAAQFIKARVTT